MYLKQRIKLVNQLGKYIISNDPDWEQVCKIASQKNNWFIPAYIDKATQAIYNAFLQPAILEQWTNSYKIPEENKFPVNVGIAMAGNIPLVGFHDFLCTFITGNSMTIKFSSKDNILLKHLIEKMYEWNKETLHLIQLSDTLKNCDAYIATGSNNSSRYFEYYFSKYPHIIRHNRTSVAILTGYETEKDLLNLSDDICSYFGLGCRNVTHISVPNGYDFLPLLSALRKYDYCMDFHQYKNNYDYQLALLLLNRKEYMSNDSILLTENESIFSPITLLHYSYYDKENDVINNLPMDNLQCIVGSNFIPFGKSQEPSITDYADGVDTMEFLLSLNI